MRKQWRDAAVLFTAFAIVAAMTGCGRADEDASVETGTPKGPITVGSKIDTEGELISSLIKLVLENAGFEVVDKSQTGTTEVVRKSIIAGEIDLYPEYSGNGHWFFFDDLTSEEKAGYKNGQVGYDTTARIDLEQNGIVWLEPIRDEQHMGACGTRGVRPGRGAEDDVRLRCVRQRWQARQGGRE